MYRFLNAALIIFIAGCGAPEKAAEPSKPSYGGTRVGHFGYGEPASAEEIAGWDIDIRPDGAGFAFPMAGTDRASTGPDVLG